jgi:hypothetical protein
LFQSPPNVQFALPVPATPLPDWLYSPIYLPRLDFKLSFPQQYHAY